MVTLNLACCRQKVCGGKTDIFKVAAICRSDQPSGIVKLAAQPHPFQIFSAIKGSD